MKVNGHEKRWFQSKKFMAAMVATVVWTGLIVAAMFSMRDTPDFTAVMLAMVLCLGFVHATYIGGQAAVDSFVRMAIVIAGGKNSVQNVVNGESGHHPQPEPEPEMEPPTDGDLTP